MILIITNKFDPHSDKVILELKKYGASVIRVNTEDFPNKINLTIRSNGSNLTGILELPKGKTLDVSKIKSVLYRKPKPFEITPFITNQTFRKFAFKECMATWEGLEYLLSSCLWINHPYRIKRAENKLYQYQIAKKVGLDIPLTLVTNDPKKAKDFCEMCLEKKSGVVVKVLNHSNNPGLFTRKITSRELKEIEVIRYAPCFFQEYVEKAYELRITVVGKKIFAAEIHSQKMEKTKVDWRNCSEIDEIPYFPHNLPQDISLKCHSLLKEMGLIFGAIDMIYTPDKRYIFLEINANGQWLWIEKLTGLQISKAIAELLIAGKESL